MGSYWTLPSSSTAASIATALQTGTQTATINTDHTLGTAVTTAGWYQLEVDGNAMANGDVLQLWIKELPLSGGTARIILFDAWYDAMDANNIILRLPELGSDQSWEAHLKQSAGTGRAFPWKILQL